MLRHVATLQSTTPSYEATEIPCHEDMTFEFCEEVFPTSDGIVKFVSYPCNIYQNRRHPSREVSICVFFAEPRNATNWPKDTWNVDAAYGDVKVEKPDTFDILPRTIASRIGAELLRAADRKPPKAHATINLPVQVYLDSLKVIKTFSQQAILLEATVVNNDLHATSVWTL
ncbi:hypothetical protein AaE_016181 [Aphanomyces astaci]|uniref:Uncharacterized protein n=1 Tax=Aphanomyces astaci TaxID=112090 RepID=A0A6A4YUP1_APHAT|nr:hypothetical protein AaE_016181 [Aphanomyces astaci]